VRIEDYRETLRGHRVLHLVGKGSKPATMPLTVPVLRVLDACRGDRTEGRLIPRPCSGKPIDRRDAYRMVLRIAGTACIPRHISPPLAAGRRDHQRPRRRRPPETLRSSPDTPTLAPPSTTTAPEATSTDTASTSSPPTSQAHSPKAA
jgi:integrase/recombinase XerD